MTVTFFLLRHAAHDNVGGFLAGRAEGIRLGEEGHQQARRLGERMRREKIGRIYTSPRERTRETATAIASACGLDAPQVSDALDEVNFGLWSGKSFEALDRDPLWRRWNTTRSLVRTPGGETIMDVQNRVLRLIETLASESSHERIALVSHADVIKAAASHILGLPPDAWSRFDIAPASVTTMVIGDWGAKIVTLNEITA